MFTELFVEAILANEQLADAVWDLWNHGLISDDVAATAWLLVAAGWSEWAKIWVNSQTFVYRSRTMSSYDKRSVP